MCGERKPTNSAAGYHSGSSPRVRGTHHRQAGRGPRRRFIPACAGNASEYSWTEMMDAVHPRVCGERRNLCGHGRPGDGSSPRVRGTHTMDERQIRDWRFIPACAGNALAEIIIAILFAVHPRVCGERVGGAAQEHPTAGSSPRVRGTPVGCSRVGAAIRFIPACAGNAAPAGDRPRATSVHPRVCGERTVRGFIGGALVGSSPRVRGTPNLPFIQPNRFRFIPACAGNAR